MWPSRGNETEVSTSCIFTYPGCKGRFVGFKRDLHRFIRFRPAVKPSDLNVRQMVLLENEPWSRRVNLRKYYVAQYYERSYLGGEFSAWRNSVFVLIFS